MIHVLTEITRNVGVFTRGSPSPTMLINHFSYNAIDDNYDTFININNHSFVNF